MCSTLITVAISPTHRRVPSTPLTRVEFTVFTDDETCNQMCMFKSLQIQMYRVHKGVFRGGTRGMACNGGMATNFSKFFYCFSERVLTFTFAICHRPSICRLSSVCRLQCSCTLLWRLKFSAMFLLRLVPWPSLAFR